MVRLVLLVCCIFLGAVTGRDTGSAASATSANKDGGASATSAVEANGKSYSSTIVLSPGSGSEGKPNVTIRKPIAPITPQIALAGTLGKTQVRNRRELVYDPPTYGGEGISVLGRNENERYLRRPGQKRGGSSAAASADEGESAAAAATGGRGQGGSSASAAASGKHSGSASASASQGRTHGSSAASAATGVGSASSSAAADRNNHPGSAASSAASDESGHGGSAASAVTGGRGHGGSAASASAGGRGQGGSAASAVTGGKGQGGSAASASSGGRGQGGSAASSATTAGRYHEDSPAASKGHSGSAIENHSIVPSGSSWTPAALGRQVLGFIKIPDLTGYLSHSLGRGTLGRIVNFIISIISGLLKCFKNSLPDLKGQLAKITSQILPVWSFFSYGSSIKKPSYKDDSERNILEGSGSEPSSKDDILGNNDGLLQKETIPGANRHKCKKPSAPSDSWFPTGLSIENIFSKVPTVDSIFSSVFLDSNSEIERITTDDPRPKCAPQAEDTSSSFGSFSNAFSSLPTVNSIVGSIQSSNIFGATGLTEGDNSFGSDDDDDDVDDRGTAASLPTEDSRDDASFEGKSVVPVVDDASSSKTFGSDGFRPRPSSATSESTKAPCTKHKAAAAGGRFRRATFGKGEQTTNRQDLGINIAVFLIDAAREQEYIPKDSKLWNLLLDGGDKSAWIRYLLEISKDFLLKQANYYLSGRSKRSTTYNDGMPRLALNSKGTGGSGLSGSAVGDGKVTGVADFQKGSLEAGSQGGEGGSAGVAAAMGAGETNIKADGHDVSMVGVGRSAGDAAGGSFVQGDGVSSTKITAPGISKSSVSTQSASSSSSGAVTQNTVSSATGIGMAGSVSGKGTIHGSASNNLFAGLATGSVTGGKSSNGGSGVSGSAMGGSTSTSLSASSLRHRHGSTISAISSD